MSKSKGNVVAPDELVERYGADALRLYILFMGAGRPGQGVEDERRRGDVRFLTRLWRLVREVAERARARATPTATTLARKAHETIRKVTDDIERRFVFNTPIAAVMELVNEMSARGRTIPPRGSRPRRPCR